MSTSKNKVTAPPVEVTRFKPPSGQVHGVVVATAVVKNKPVRVGHAYLERTEPKLSVSIPKTLTVDELNGVLAVLGEFAQTVRTQQEDIAKT